MRRLVGAFESLAEIAAGTTTTIQAKSAGAIAAVTHFWRGIDTRSRSTRHCRAPRTAPYSSAPRVAISNVPTTRWLTATRTKSRSKATITPMIARMTV